MCIGGAEDEPLLAELDRRRAVVFIQPSALPGPQVEGIPAFADDFLLDTTRAACRLVRSGAVGRFRRLKIVLAHAGGFLPHASHRIATALSLEMQRSPLDLLDDLGSFYFDTALSGSWVALPSLLAFARSGHVVFGSDWPYAPAVAVSYFTGQVDAYSGRDAGGRSAIDHGNAACLFEKETAAGTDYRRPAGVHGQAVHSRPPIPGLTPSRPARGG